AANVDDGSFAWWVLDELQEDEYPRLQVVFADKKYNNHDLRQWLAESGRGYRLEISGKREGERERWTNAPPHASATTHLRQLFAGDRDRHARHLLLECHQWPACVPPSTCRSRRDSWQGRGE